MDDPTDAIPEDVSDSGLFDATVTDNLSNAGNSWYFRVSVG